MIDAKEIKEYQKVLDEMQKFCDYCKLSKPDKKTCAKCAYPVSMKAIRYRIPQDVEAKDYCRDVDGDMTYEYYCPKCSARYNYLYYLAACCKNCGQALGWKKVAKYVEREMK